MWATKKRKKKKKEDLVWIFFGLQGCGGYMAIIVTKPGPYDPTG